MPRITELMVDDAYDAERAAHMKADLGTGTKRAANMFSMRAAALGFAYEAQIVRDSEAQTMAEAVALRWMLSGTAV